MTTLHKIAPGVIQTVFVFVRLYSAHSQFFLQYSNVSIWSVIFPKRLAYRCVYSLLPKRSVYGFSAKTGSLCVWKETKCLCGLTGAERRVLEPCH